MVAANIYNFFITTFEEVVNFKQSNPVFYYGSYSDYPFTYDVVANVDNSKELAILKQIFEENFYYYQYKKLSIITTEYEKNLFFFELYSYFYNLIIYAFLMLQLFMVFSKNIFDFFENNFTKFIISKIKNQIEQNIGSFEDFMLIISLFFSIFFFNFFFFYSFNVSKIFFYVVAVCLYFVILIPVRIVFFMGASFMVFIKGSSIYKKLILELVYDITGYLAFFMRFILQCVRILLLFVFYFMIHEYIFELPKNILTDYANSFVVGTSGNIYQTAILIVRWLFEFFDSLLTIFTQIAAYFLISFWLFSFLYTTIFKKNTKFFKWVKKWNKLA